MIENSSPLYLSPLALKASMPVSHDTGEAASLFNLPS